MALLGLKPGCECCDAGLLPASSEARICTYECTYCATYADEMGNICKSCGGSLVPRPIRPAAHLADRPASTIRLPCSRSRVGNGLNIELWGQT